MISDTSANHPAFHHFVKQLLLLVCIALGSCAGLQDASFDQAFATAVIRNDTQAIFGNCNSRNAVYPLNGLPPMYYAASYGNEDVIDLLYNRGASLQTRSHDGKSLAYAAAANGHDQTARKLVALNAGSARDLQSGQAAYRHRKASEAEAQKLQAAALAWLFAAVASGGGASTDNSVEAQKPKELRPMSTWSNAEYQQAQREIGN